MTSRSSSPSASPKSMGKRSLARKCERGCCLVATYFPLPVVYGLTTWAVWTSAGIGFRHGFTRWSNPIASILIVLLFLLLNWCYTKAVFTPPGSPIDQKGAAGYSSLPTHESPHKNAPSLQAKSTGEVRFCKKCSARKPDRTHHCSTCKQCVLKMDHHCPWLATCVGLHNYKAFLLFLIYVSVYCWAVLGVTTLWVWKEALHDRYDESLSPINQILLCVVSGIIAIVITGFTIWHISLAMRGMTTIECLEKTRYLKPIRQQMRNQKHAGGHTAQKYGQQLVEIHANAVPGATRDEEGEVMLPNGHTDPQTKPSAANALRNNYADLERRREQDRYEDYLDEQDSEQLPRAFDLGWRRNLLHLFGAKRLFWFFPICNTTGDGWHWEVSDAWLEARERQSREREAQTREDLSYEDDYEGGEIGGPDAYSGRGRWPAQTPGERRFVSPDGSPSSRMSMQTLRRRGSFDDIVDESDDEGEEPASFQQHHSYDGGGGGKYD